MKVILIGTDRKILEQGSAVRRRMVEYGKMFEELNIVIFSLKSKVESHKVQISENVWAYSTNSKNKLFYFFDSFLIIRKLIKNSELKIKNLIVSTQDPFETGLVGLVLKLRYKLPLQVQIHTDFHNKYFILHSPLNFIRFFLSQIVLSFADSVRTVSARVAKSVGSLCENVDVLPIYVETTDNRLQITEKKEGKMIFLTVARLEKEKDLGTMIRAFAEVVKSNPNIELVIVGDGSQKKELKSLAVSCNLSSKIIFVGWSDNTAKYYANADVYVSSSLYEGYGMSVVEAAQYGLPLVLSDTGVAGEIFQDGEEAFICRQKDVAQFAGAMKKLAENGGVRLEMGEKARNASKLVKIEREDYLNRYKLSFAKAREFFDLGHGIFRRNILLRYLVAGITAASSNILLFYFFTYPLHIWYLASSIAAYLLSFILSFVLQKFWTFRDKSIDKVHHQLFKYGVVVLIGMAVNAGCMFAFVDMLSVWPMLAQVLTGAIIAVFNFFAYKIFIFK